MVVYSSCVEGLWTWGSLGCCTSTTRRQYSISHKWPPEIGDYHLGKVLCLVSNPQLFLHSCDEVCVTRAGHSGWFVLQAQSPAAELSPEELSISSHQPELSPHLSAHLLTSSIAVAARSWMFKRQNKHFPQGQRASETPAQPLLLSQHPEESDQSCQVRVTAWNRAHGDTTTPPGSCPTGQDNPWGFPHLLRTSKTVPSAPVPSPLDVAEHHGATEKLWFTLTLLRETPGCKYPRGT